MARSWYAAVFAAGRPFGERTGWVRVVDQEGLRSWVTGRARRGGNRDSLNGARASSAGHDEPFYPSALERGRRSCRAVMLAVAEMYIKGVSTRDAEAVMSKFGLESLSSSQVSRAAKLLDEELEAWRNRPLGEIRYLLLDARYEKVREAGVVRDAAVLSAIGIGPDQRRRVLGVSCAISEAEVHWRVFLESLVARGMRGVAYIVSDAVDSRRV